MGRATAEEFLASAARRFPANGSALVLLPTGRGFGERRVLAAWEGPLQFMGAHARAIEVKERAFVEYERADCARRPPSWPLVAFL